MTSQGRSADRCARNGSFPKTDAHGMAATALYERACETIESDKQQLFSLNHEIWSHPELGLEEHHAHNILTRYLKERGFSVEENFIKGTGFRATYSPQIQSLESEVKGKFTHICILCEYDALPELGHASGHNLIAESAVAVGSALKSVLELNGNEAKITILGTPDQEGNGCKVEAISQGLFQDVDIAMMVQPYKVNIAKPTMLTIMRLKLRYIGKAAHACAQPWEGRNALDAAVLCYNNISALRQQLKSSMRIHGIISKGGIKPNIIPEETEMRFYLRARDHQDMIILQQKANAAFVAAAKATGCELQWEFSETPYSNLCSNDRLAMLYQKHAERLGMEFVTDPVELSLPVGSTDMGNVSHVVPSILPTFSIIPKESGNHSVANHSAEFTQIAGTELAHECVLSASKAMAMAAIDVITSPEILKEVKEEFQERVQSNAAAVTTWH
ncbi:xaa-Arg dipeptidase-like isoform X2 [Ptychodera flava]|uniref:xaa-Arg dipeptidase-like isoform X2 n=1 Tax=Ptychodera flava TaxID=63121 RepID=UPI00396A049B